jgi:hypothetical protein
MPTPQLDPHGLAIKQLQDSDQVVLFVKIRAYQTRPPGQKKGSERCQQPEDNVGDG